mmetsp:Transcript_8524/g.17079  ORF Transcript_8524/g.17079 Transcript_8524/m.17079 type:complete len:90 (+) Transcript_8524:281-550(+)
MPPRPPSKFLIGFSTALLAGTAFVLPAYVLQRNAAAVRNNEPGALSTGQEEALPVNAVKRGVFINSGSRDAGADPNWKDGRYVGRRNNQ